MHCCVPHVMYPARHVRVIHFSDFLITIHSAHSHTDGPTAFRSGRWNLVAPTRQLALRFSSCRPTTLPSPAEQPQPVRPLSLLAVAGNEILHGCLSGTGLSGTAHSSVYRRHCTPAGAWCDSGTLLVRLSVMVSFCTVTVCRWSSPSPRSPT